MFVAVTAVLLFIAPATARANGAAFELRTLRTQANIAPAVHWLEDPDGKLELGEVMKADGFNPSGGEDLSVGYVRSAYWLRFAVVNASKQSDRWLLEVGYPHLARVDLFAVHPDGRVDHVRGGNDLPFAARLIESPSFSFPIQTPAGETTRFFLRVSSEGALRAPLVAWRMGAYTSNLSQRNAWLWMFWGGAVLMAAFNLGVAALLRSREYALCALMLLAQGFVVFTLSGETYHYFAPSHPVLASHTHAVSYVLLALTIQLYGLSAMKQLAKPPSTLRLLSTTIPLTYVMLLFSALGPMWLTIRVSLVFSVGMAIFALHVLVSLRSYRELRFQLTSHYVLMLTFPLAVVAYANIIRPHPLAFLAANLGCGLSAVLTSLALPQSIRDMGKRLASMNLQLQSNVVELEAALESAAQATKSKDQFMANMSHELRTPLNAIINVPQGLIEDFEQMAAARCMECQAVFLLDSGERFEGVPCAACGGALQAHGTMQYRGDPERSVRYLRKVERCGHHLLRMVNDVLDFSKMEAGHLALEPTHFLLGELIVEAVDEMSEPAASKQIRIELELVPNGTLSYGDPLRLKQVLFNLLSNAIKFSEPGSRVLVRWRRETERDVVAVVDSGIGIAPEHQERVFETFEQVHGGQRKYGGTGLGLAISRALARRHGGELRVESAVGEGSTFVLEIPRPAMSSAQLSA